MADLVERLRAYLVNGKLHVLDSMLAETIEEAIDEIDGLRRDVAYEQSRADRLIDTMQQARLELSMLKAGIEAAPVLELPSRETLRSEGPHVVLHTAWAEKVGLAGKRVRLLVEE